MNRTIFACLILGAALASGGMASAHDDYSKDGKPSAGKRCDTWYRAGHERPSTTTNDGAYSDHHTSEFDNGEVAPGVYVHNHTGHYVVRHDAFYVEIVGGGGYSNDDRNQGGYFQGEVDPGSGAPDADFHGDVFAGTNGGMVESNPCVSVADNKVGDEGDQP